MLGLHHHITTANSMKISRPDSGISKNLNPAQFQAQLAIWLIWTHSWRSRALLLPCAVMVAKTIQGLAFLFGCMSWCLSAGNGRSHFHILLFNEDSTVLSNAAVPGSIVTCIYSGHLNGNIYFISPNTLSTFWLYLRREAGSGGQQSFWDCVSLCVMMLSSVLSTWL